MTHPSSHVAACVAALTLFLASSANALSIREWRKHDRNGQAIYVGAAVSMAANMYAAQGDTAKARCIMDWYFRGTPGKEPTGPHDLALEIGIAERADANKHMIEGVVLGAIDRACTQAQK